MKWFNKVIDKVKEKEKAEDLLKRRETALINLLTDVEILESLKIKIEVDALYKASMEKKLKKITEEKNKIEEFLAS